jgi:hypothetical protein
MGRIKTQLSAQIGNGEGLLVFSQLEIDATVFHFKIQWSGGCR